MLKLTLKNNILNLIIFAICICLIIISIISVQYYRNNETEVVLDDAEYYGDIISNNEEEEGKSAYIEIKEEPSLVAIETIDQYTNEYYVVYDENNYMYIVQLKKSTYNTICDEYNKNPDDFSYLIMGRLASVPYELEKIIIDEFNESFEDIKLNRFNYNQYFGTTYLNEDILTSSETAIGISELCCIVAIIFAVLYLIVIVKGLINTKKSFKYIDKEELKNELSQSDAIKYKKAKIFLLDNYFVSMDVGMIAHKYSDIAWVYITHNAKTKWGATYYSVTNKSNMVVYLKDGWKYTTATITIKEKEVYSEIIEELAKKNPEIMIGYTFENLNNYYKIKNQNKK